MTTQPPQIDQARIALALTILQTKPPTLSIQTYIHLLRTHTAPSSRRHLDTSAFWHAQAAVNAARVQFLQTRLRELESSSASPLPAPRDRDWEVFGKDGDGEGEGVFELVSALRVLSFAVTPAEVLSAVTGVGSAVRGVVAVLGKGRYVPARVGRVAVKVGQGEDVKGVFAVVGGTLGRLVVALQGLAKAGEGEYTTAAACVVIETVTGLVSCLHVNSRALVDAGGGGRGDGRVEVKDLRVGVCDAVVQALVKLDPKVCAEASVIEGVMCYLIEGAGSILSAKGHETEAVKETSWYIMKMLKEIMPSYNCLQESELGKNKREELREVFMNGVFGPGLGKLSGESGRQGGQTSDVLDAILASPFTKAIWGLMGWSVFSAKGINGITV